MPKDLYIRLRTGPCVHVTDQWNGNAPTEKGMVDVDGIPINAEGREVSDPWRNIHRIGGTMKASEGSITVTPPAPMSGGPTLISTVVGGDVPVAAAIIPDGNIEVKQTAGSYSSSASLVSYETTKGLVPTGFKATISDDVAGKNPRQFPKVYTWLTFLGADGTPYDWRKDEVLGWGDQPPIDL